MKLKLALSFILPAAILLGSTGCVTTTNSYSRDIVYRDGSYYSPADEEYGDYYYEPEPDYAYYDSYDYGFGYGYNDSYRCRFSYYDRYCNNGWGSSYLNFGGLSIFFGSPGYYDYGYGYGYGYPYYGYYGYPYYGYNPHPHNNNTPIPMPKRPRPGISAPDNGPGSGPGMQVIGEQVWAPKKPMVLDQGAEGPANEPVPRRRDMNP